MSADPSMNTEAGHPQAGHNQAGHSAAGNVPTGFVQFPTSRADGFGALCGPFWIRADGDALIAGFRVEARHCNPAGICHGGMLATFCDFHLAVSAQFQNRLGTLITPTINLSLDYLAPTPNGAWVEARAEFPKITRGMIFANEIVTADGEPVVRAHGIFKIPSADSALGAAGRDSGARLRAFLAKAQGA